MGKIDGHVSPCPPNKCGFCVHVLAIRTYWHNPGQVFAKCPNFSSHTEKSVCKTWRMTQRSEHREIEKDVPGVRCVKAGNLWETAPVSAEAEVWLVHTWPTHISLGARVSWVWGVRFSLIPVTFLSTFKSLGVSVPMCVCELHWCIFYSLPSTRVSPCVFTRLWQGRKQLLSGTTWKADSGRWPEMWKC